MNKIVEMQKSHLSGWLNEQTLLSDGIIMICRKGSCTINVNFDKWVLSVDAVIVLFPNDVVSISEETDDFEVEMLQYSADVLREASLKMEQTVYDHLRHDRCRTDRTIVVDIINSIFALLQVYFRQPECTTLYEITLLQLKSFFLGFYDYTCRFPQQLHRDIASARKHELFTRFMQLLEVRYLDSRDVQYYASLMNITPKYLSIIVREITGITAKVVISHYIILQMKQELINSTFTVQQLTFKFHFEDPAFFCRFFKSHTGMTPQTFRNMHRVK